MPNGDDDVILRLKLDFEAADRELKEYAARKKREMDITVPVGGAEERPSARGDRGKQGTSLVNYSKKSTGLLHDINKNLTQGFRGLSRAILGATIGIAVNAPDVRRMIGGGLTGIGYGVSSMGGPITGLLGTIISGVGGLINLVTAGSTQAIAAAGQFNPATAMAQARLQMAEMRRNMYLAQLTGPAAVGAAGMRQRVIEDPNVQSMFAAWREALLQFDQIISQWIIDGAPSLEKFITGLPDLVRQIPGAIDTLKDETISIWKTVKSYATDVAQELKIEWDAWVMVWNGMIEGLAEFFAKMSQTWNKVVEAWDRDVVPWVDKRLEALVKGEYAAAAGWTPHEPAPMKDVGWWNIFLESMGFVTERSFGTLYDDVNKELYVPGFLPPEVLNALQEAQLGGVDVAGPVLYGGHYKHPVTGKVRTFTPWL